MILSIVIQLYSTAMVIVINCLLKQICKLRQQPKVSWMLITVNQYERLFICNFTQDHLLLTMIGFEIIKSED